MKSQSEIVCVVEFVLNNNRNNGNTSQSTSITSNEIYRIRCNNNRNSFVKERILQFDFIWFDYVHVCDVRVCLHLYLWETVKFSCHKTDKQFPCNCVLSLSFGPLSIQIHVINFSDTKFNQSILTFFINCFCPYTSLYAYKAV